MNNKWRRVLMGIGLVGAGAALSFAQPASAQPPHHDNNKQWDNRDNRRNDRRNDRRQMRVLEGIVTADRQGNGFTLRVGRQQVRVQVQGGQRENVKRGDRVRVYGFSSGNVFHAQNMRVVKRSGNEHWRNDRDRNDRDRNDRDRNDRDRNDRDRKDDKKQTYTGTVVGVRGAQAVDVNINGRNYNVFTYSALPRDLSQGDTVRVYGERVGDADIRNANIAIIVNR